MEWSRLKNIIILILLLVNSFLLVLVAARRGEARQYERTALEQTIQVLEGQGIEIDAKNLAPLGQLPPLTVERDLEVERKLACALLGDGVEVDNRGGGLYLYRGPWGELSVRPGGELSAELADVPHWQANDPGHHAAALLDRMGVDAEQTALSTQGRETIVRFRQMWNKVPVFSCGVEFVYRGGALGAVRGVLLTSGQKVGEPGELLPLPTALMRFLDGVTSAGDVCSAIRSMEAGYRATPQPLSGGTRLTAAWFITSDTAEYYLDGATGALTRISEQ